MERIYRIFNLRLSLRARGGVERCGGCQSRIENYGLFVFVYSVLVGIAVAGESVAVVKNNTGNKFVILIGTRIIYKERRQRAF